MHEERATQKSAWCTKEGAPHSRHLRERGLMSGLHPSVARAIQRWQQREHDAKVGEAASQPAAPGNKNKRNRDETTDEVKAVAVSETLAADRPAQRQKAGPSKADEVKAAAVLRQVNFYFSDENFRKSKYLRGQAGKNDAGFISLALITGFARMQELGASVEFVAATMREQAGSGVVVSSDGQQIRRRVPLQVEPGVGEDHTTVPETKVGAIIGKGGVTIKQMIQESGCSITIADKGVAAPQGGGGKAAKHSAKRKGRNSEGKRLVYLRGTPDQVKKAKKAIQRRLDDHARMARMSRGSRAGRHPARTSARRPSYYADPGDSSAGNYGGFSNDAMDELACQGIKPWDDCAGAALDVLFGGY